MGDKFVATTARAQSYPIAVNIAAVAPVRVSVVIVNLLSLPLILSSAAELLHAL
jgi:hypothetical protein